jgi:hypothetical protein
VITNGSLLDKKVRNSSVHSLFTETRKIEAWLSDFARVWLLKKILCELSNAVDLEISCIFSSVSRRCFSVKREQGIRTLLLLKGGTFERQGWNLMSLWATITERTDKDL